MSGGFLEQMARSSTDRAERARARVPYGEMLARARDSAPAPRLVLHPRGFDLIAELKLRSPAAGRAAEVAAHSSGGRARDPAVPLAERVRDYARAGAAAVSVLTEPARFEGALEHLESAVHALGAARVPAMRKDFLVDPYQVLEARAAGAGGVLVILRMLSEPQAEALLDCAQHMGLFVLLEAFDQADLARAHGIVERRAGRASPADAQARLLVGLNCRDLDTLQVVPGRLEALAGALPASVPRVAESGVGSAADAASVAAAGYELALVGSALMSGADPGALVRDMLEEGRAAAARRRPAAPAPSRSLGA